MPSAGTIEITDIKSRIEACEARSYHLSSRIQAHGLLVAADLISLQIIRISANAGSILGVPNEMLLSGTVTDLLAPESAVRVQNLVAEIREDRVIRPRPSVIVDIAGPNCFTTAAVLYRSGALLGIEIEPPRLDTPAETIAGPSSRFFNFAADLARDDVPSDRLAGIVCDAIRQITGFDRVYFCQFDLIGHGHVSAESNNKVLSLLMDHHFPAIDIPQAARQTMIVNPFRLIPDVDAPAIPIIGGDGFLDLTLSMGRAVADSHLRYLRNMGVGASLSFSVVADGRLQALFGGHHHAARHVSFRQMAACRHLVELFKARFDSLKMREDRVALAKRTQVLHGLAAAFLRADCDLGSFIVAHHATFCELMDADDVLCRFAQRDHLGRLLPEQQAGELLDFLAQKVTADAGVFQSDSLVTESACLRQLCPAVAGALAVSLDLSGSNIIAWLRSETVVEQTWSGDPLQSLEVDDSGSVGPRRSFLAYIRETRGTSRAWSTTAGDLAHQLRHTFSQVLARYYEAGMRKAAEQTIALKASFVANVSHELRSPMHSIIGFSEILAGDDGSMTEANRQRFLGTIIASSRRLLHLIDDLLDLSALDAGKMAFSFNVGEVLPTIERAVAGVDALAHKKQIEILVRDDGRRTKVTFDTARMEQVFINLLSNALKFSPQGSTIVIRLGSASPDHPRLIIEISDQGIGIPARELDQIFDKFVQSSRTETGAGGTGLGLAICREIIEAHHGRIWAANNATGGASLFVELPPTALGRNEVSP